jgi:O-antigen/teichoic acid export membrane protein
VSLASRTFRNTALVVGSRAVAKVATFVVVILLWNHLAAADYGRFGAMIVYVSLAQLLADLGTQTVFVRDVARDREEFDRYLGNLISARLLLVVLSALVLAAALRLLAPTLFPYTLGAFALLVTVSYSGLLRSAFYARGTLGYEVLAIIGEAVILLGLTLFAVAHGATWDAFLWVYAASYLFTCLLGLAVIFVVWRERPSPRLDLHFLRGILSSGAPLALGFVITSVYAQVDVVLLQVFTNYRMVGWYVAANKYVDAIAWIPQSAMNAVFPALSLLSVSGKDRVAIAYEKSYRMLAVLAVPLAIGMALTAPSLVRATTPHGYEQVIPALRILALSVVLLFLSNAFIYTLTAINRQSDFTRLALATLGLNVILNLALIPPFGYLGASWAAVLTELGLFVGGWWLVRRHLYALPAVRSIARILLGGAVMGVVVFLLQAQPILLVVVIGAAVYAATLVLVRAVDAQEWRIVRNALMR